MPKPINRKKGIKVDFTGVEAGGSRSVPDGRYILEVRKIEEKEGQDSGQPYLSWVYAVVGPKCKGATIYDNVSLQPQALWRLRGLLESMGIEVEEGAMDLDLTDFIGKQVGAEITNEEYQGKSKPRITGFDSVDSIEGEDGEEEAAPPPGKPTKPATKLKVGSKVSFKDDDGSTKKGVVTATDGEMATVDVKGEEWEVETAELSVD